MSPRLALPMLRRHSGAGPDEMPAGGEPAVEGSVAGRTETDAAPVRAQGTDASDGEAFALKSLGRARVSFNPDVRRTHATPAQAPAPERAEAASTPEPSAKPAATSPGHGLAILAGYKRAVLSWIEEDGYPMNVDVEIEVRPAEGAIRFTGPAGFQVPPGAMVALTGSHVRVLQSGGFDQRRHVTIWGAAATRPRGRFAVSPERVWVWDELAMPLPAAYERSLPQARRFFEALSDERGEPVRPRVSTAMLLVRATRAPFLSATFVPVLLGLAVAARVGLLDAVTAAITLAAAVSIHLGLNVANDVFDTLQGADDANKTPTRFSGGSRVLQQALVTIRQMSLLAAGCYGLAAVLGIVLLFLRGSVELVALGLVGLFISLAYTAPPMRLAYRGLGEVAAAIGFGPVMLLGTYVVQSRGVLSSEAALLSAPVALLVAMILYVNEVPDRAGDAEAGKRTLPVRWSRRAVIRGYDLSVAAAFAVVVGGVAAGLLPIPTLLILLAVPLARRVHVGLARFYDSPFLLMDAMAMNIRLHMTAGSLLLAGYLLTIGAQSYLNLRLFLW